MNDVNAHFIALQAAVVARLEADTVLDVWNEAVPWPASTNGQPVQVVSEIKGDIANQLTTSLEAMGIVMIVMTPLGKMRQANSLSLDLISPLKIQIQEQVTLNRSGAGTGIPALSIVALALKRLNAWPPMIYAGAAKPQRIFAQEQCFTLLSDTPELIYDVDFFAPINLNANLA